MKHLCLLFKLSSGVGPQVANWFHHWKSSYSLSDYFDYCSKWWLEGLQYYFHHVVSSLVDKQQFWNLDWSNRLIVQWIKLSLSFEWVSVGLWCFCSLDLCHYNYSSCRCFFVFLGCFQLLVAINRLAYFWFWSCSLGQVGYLCPWVAVAWFQVAWPLVVLLDWSL